MNSNKKSNNIRFTLGGGYFTNKNVKGLTLIELLAVIIILAIIAMIVVPTILGIINRSKDEAYKETLNNVFHAYEIYEVDNKLKDNPNYEKKTDVSKLPLDSNLKGEVFRNEDGEIEIEEVTDGVYCASGTKEDLSLIKGSCEDLKNTLNLKINAIPSATKIEVVVETILGAPINYSYKIKKENYKREVNNIKSNRNTFNKLNLNTEYEITVIATNRYGVEKILTKTVRTLSVEQIKLNLTPQDEYIKSGKVTITYPKINNGIYEYKWLSDSEWKESKDLIKEIEAKTDTLIARIREEENVLLTNQITINNIDNIVPQVTLTTPQQTTNSIIIPFSVIEEHIKEITCKYSDTLGSYTSDGTVGESLCTLSNLNSNKNYYYEICVSDKAGNKTCKTGSTKTSEIINPDISITHTPSNAGLSITNGYSKQEVANITFNNVGITTPTYYVKTTQNGISNINVTESCGENTTPETCDKVTSTNTLIANTWYKVSGNIKVTYSEATSIPITIYAITTDGKNIGEASTGTTLKIDKTSPEVTLGTLNKTTNNLIINYELKELESGISTVTCKYSDTSGSYTSNGTVVENSCTLNNLNSNKDYYYEICASDNVGNHACQVGSTKTSKIINPDISITHIPSNAGLSTTNGYSKQEVANITFNNVGIITPTYYIKSTKVGTTNNSVVGECGIGDKPTNCTTSSVTTLAANTWYRVSENINVTYNQESDENGTIYALVYDGVNYSGATTGTISKIDRTTPAITLERVIQNTNNLVISYTLSDTKSGINTYTCKYGTEEGKYTSNGTVRESACTLSNLTNNKDYYYEICVSDKAGNNTCKTGSTKTSEITNPIITMTSTPTTPVNGYVRETTASIIFNNTNITNPTYYIKTTLDGITNNSVIGECGNGDKPTNCITSSVTTLTANTWYKVGGNINVTYNTETDSNGTIYALVNDGVNYSGATTGTILKIGVNPTVKLDTEKVTIGEIPQMRITLTKQIVGISGSTLKYCVDTNNTCIPNIEATSGVSILLDNIGKFYVRYQAFGGNGLNSEIGSKECILSKITGMPIITASWPSTSQIKTDITGVNAIGDTIIYRYSLGNIVKQDWTTNDSYTFTGLSSATSYTIKVETKLKDTEILGETKTATIYTSKSVSGTNSGWSSSSSCSSSSYTVSASGVYPSITLISPSCSSYQEQTGSTPKYTTCSTTLSNQSSCPSSASCSTGGYTGTVSKSSQSLTTTNTCNYSGDVQTGTTPKYTTCSITLSNQSSCSSSTSCSTGGYTRTVSKSGQSSTTINTCNYSGNIAAGKTTESKYCKRSTTASVSLDYTNNISYTTSCSITNPPCSGTVHNGSFVRNYYIYNCVYTCVNGKTVTEQYNKSCPSQWSSNCPLTNSIKVGQNITATIDGYINCEVDAYKTCTTSYTTTGTCDGTRSCSTGGYTGMVSKSSQSSNTKYACNYSGDIQTGTTPTYTNCTTSYTTTGTCASTRNCTVIGKTGTVNKSGQTSSTKYTCNYSGSVQTGTQPTYINKYKATYSGVVKPTQTVY